MTFTPAGLQYDSDVVQEDDVTELKFQSKGHLHKQRKGWLEIPFGKLAAVVYYLLMRKTQNPKL